MKIFKFFIYSLVFFGSLQGLEKPQLLQAREKLKRLSKEEKKQLEKHLRYFFFFDAFAFTLFGDKPITTHTYYYDPGVPCKNCCDPDLDNELFWQLWQKACKTYETEKYLFQRYSYKRTLDSRCETIKGYILVNKTALNDCLEKYQEDFKTYLGRVISEQEILDSIRKNQGIFYESIYSNEFLIGMLFGFGRGNAWKYCNQENAGKKRMQSFCPPKITHPFFHSVTMMPQFAADFTLEETQSLYRKYRRQLKEIRKEYRGRDFLEATIAKFMEECGQNALGKPSRKSPSYSLKFSGRSAHARE